MIAFLRPLRGEGTWQEFSDRPFATGFPVSQYGPIGLAFDSSGNLFVMNVGDGYLYKFGPAGGVASKAMQVNASPITGIPRGITFSKDGHLYLAREANDVVELDPAKGTIIRTVANIRNATGIATDPLSGDLFVSDVASTISRISKFADGPGMVTAYASQVAVDGLTFAPDGTLYAAIYPTGVAKVSGTNSPTPGVVTRIADVPTVDGIAVAADATFLLGNRNAGKITKVDLTTNPPKLTDIFTGGSRGDFSAVGPDGCMYATQTSSVIKVTNADGTCSLAPSGTATSGATLIGTYGWILALCFCLIIVGGLGGLIGIFLKRRIG